MVTALTLCCLQYDDITCSHACYLLSRARACTASQPGVETTRTPTRTDTGTYKHTHVRACTHTREEEEEEAEEKTDTRVVRPS